MIYEEWPHTITFQIGETEPDGMGGYKVVNWKDSNSIEAFVCPVNSEESFIAQQNEASIDYHVFYPYQDVVKDTMRIKYKDMYLTIQSKPIDQGGQGEILMLKCALEVTK